MWRVLKNMYRRTDSKIRIEGELTGSYSIKCGVKEGSDLSTILFSLYINDIVKELKKKMDEFKKRYGDRATDVMYATATKMAMKDDSEEDEETGT